MASPAPTAPAGSLLELMRTELTRVLPFSRMDPAHVDALVAAAEQAYYMPGEVVLDPSMGPVRHLRVIRRGSVTSRRAADPQGGFEYIAGDMFPVGAMLAERAVSGPYIANEDTFCLIVPGELVRTLAQRSAPFAGFLNDRAAQLLELSRRALQASHASLVLAEQSLEARLDSLQARVVFECRPETPLAQALGEMQSRRVGSIVVSDAAGIPVGILTRHDIVGRVTLPQRPLSTPIGAVMSTPVRTLEGDRTLLEAALVMSTHGIRHVPIMKGGRIASIVSERDLFALQRLSLRQLGGQIQLACDIPTLQLLAQEIRSFAGHLLGQGVAARQLTELISRLNDTLTARLVSLVAERRGADMSKACWLAFGSEGRSEQTLATDQDNGIVFVNDAPESARADWLALGREVNDALDACGYPLCKGNVMASNPACCLSEQEWHEAFARWIESGSPGDLLKASIYFDLRPLCGAVALAERLRAAITARAQAVPRFIKQMAEDVLRQPSPLSWRGAIATSDVDGRPLFDLKLQGSSILVAVARLYALANGVAATGTRARLEAVAGKLGASPREAQSWVIAFEFLQMLRLQVQLKPEARFAAGGPANPNRIDVSILSDLERTMLKEACKVTRSLQQRVELDYRR